MSGCSDPSIASLGIVFEIEEVRNLPWNTVPNWLWYCFLPQGAEATCEFLSSPEISFLTLVGRLHWRIRFNTVGAGPYLIPQL